MQTRKQNNKNRVIQHALEYFCDLLTMSFTGQGEQSSPWNENIQSTNFTFEATLDKQRPAAKNRTNKEVLNAEL